MKHHSGTLQLLLLSEELTVTLTSRASQRTQASRVLADRWWCAEHGRQTDFRTRLFFNINKE